MSELIGRQAAIDALDCINGVEEVLRSLPTIQPEPPIIKCKDCKWWRKQKDSAQGRCRLLGIYPTGAWYCGNAERRTDDKTNKGSSC